MRANATEAILLLTAFACSSALEVHTAYEVAGHHHGFREHAEVEEADGDSMVDQLFLETDADKDGKLTLAEVEENAKISRLKEIADAQRQGGLDEVKHLAWDKSSEDNLRHLFELSDQNKDGFLSKAETIVLAKAESENNGEEDEQSIAQDREGQKASLLEDDVRTFRSSADTNYDGVLSLEEVSCNMKHVDGQELAKEFGFDKVNPVEDRFKDADINHDGTLDVRELLLMHRKADGPALLEDVGHGSEDVHRGHTDGNLANMEMQEAKETFDELDNDKDGEVQWSDVLGKLDKASDVQAIKGDFDAADENKDGSLDYNDFAHFAKALVKRLGNAAGRLFPTLVALPAVESTHMDT